MDDEVTWMADCVELVVSFSADVAARWVALELVMVGSAEEAELVAATCDAGWRDGV